MLQSRAGRPPLGRPACDFLRSAPTFSWTLLIFSRWWCRLLGFNAENCRPAGLELAILGPLFYRHLDQSVHEVHGGVPVQKISASVENGLFNPCARPFSHNFSICLYIQCIGVYWRVPSGLLARQDVFVEVPGRPACSLCTTRVRNL